MTSGGGGHLEGWGPRVTCRFGKVGVVLRVGGVGVGLRGAHMMVWACVWVCGPCTRVGGRVWVWVRVILVFPNEF